MNEKEIRRWYREHGMSPPDQEPTDRAALMGDLLDRESVPLWTGRSVEDVEYMKALADFFDPYIALMARPKGNLIREYMGLRKTEAEIGKEYGLSQQAVSQALQRALRTLTRLIAMDDPEWKPPADKRRRDYEGEKKAAERVFDRYWRRRRASYGAFEGEPTTG